jgi:hypothetical protein
MLHRAVDEKQKGQQIRYACGIVHVKRMWHCKLHCVYTRSDDRAPT